MNHDPSTQPPAAGAQASPARGLRFWPVAAAPGPPDPARRDSPADTSGFPSLFSDAAVLNWGVQVRWITLLMLVLLGLLLTWSGALTGRMFLETALLTVPVTAYNLLFLVLLHLAPLWPSPRPLRLLRWLQTPADILVMTFALHFTGGATTPLVVVYVFFIVTAAVFAPRWGTYAAALEISLCFGALVLLELTILHPIVNPALGAIYPPAPGAVAIYLWHLLALLGVIWIVAYASDRLGRRIVDGEELVGRQLRDVTMLYRFSDNLSSATNLDQAMQYIVTELAAILTASSCSLMLINEHGQAEFRAVTGFSRAALAAYRRHPLNRDNPLLAAVLNGGHGIFAPTVDAVPGLREVLIRPEIRSFYSFPLRAEDRIVGLLNLSFDAPYTMPANTYDLVASCSRQAGLAIERTILYQEAQRAAREMATLYWIGLATSSSLEIAAVLRQVADQVQGVLASDSFVLALYEAETGLLDFVLQRDRGAEWPPEAFPLEAAGAAGWIVRTQQALLIRHWDQEITTLPFVPNTIGDPIQSYLGVPLVANDRVIGILSVQKLDPYAYDENHLRLLSAIAGQAALALENARLHETAREQALRDSLTGAYNHAALLARIDQAVTAARAAESTVALIMLDIDFFKHYNDTYGHVAGDDALRAVVQAITQHVKSVDTVGRWGGEEFGVVLPGAGPDQALQVARRIRTTLATLEMPTYGGRRLPAPTISQGIACYPAQATSSAQLVDHADSALYQAKERGRDTIVQWHDLGAPVRQR